MVFEYLVVGQNLTKHPVENVSTEWLFILLQMNFSTLENLTKENGFSVLHNALFGTGDLSIPLQNLHPNILTEDNSIKFINSKYPSTLH